MKTQPFLGYLAIMTGLIVMTEDIVPAAGNNASGDSRGTLLHRFQAWMRGLTGRTSPR